MFEDFGSGLVFFNSSGVGPFGVSLLVNGYDDNGQQLYPVDPSGSYLSWKPSAMGENVSNAKTFLEKRFEGQISGKNIETGIIVTDKKFSMVSYGRGNVLVGNRNEGWIRSSSFTKAISGILSPSKLLSSLR